MTTTESHRRLVLKAHAASDIGQRQNNEDAYLVNERLGLFIVADGMGGHDKGEVASWFSSRELERIVTTLLTSPDPSEFVVDTKELPSKPIDRESLLEYAVIRINRKIFEENEARVAEFLRERDRLGTEMAEYLAKKERMGTTLVSLFFRGKRAYVTSVGDSRAYRIAGAAIAQLTHDHSWTEERVRTGELSIVEARGHKKRNVLTRSIGFKPNVQADIEILTAYPGDRFLLCSDGLSNVLSSRMILELGRTGTPREAAERLVREAKELGGKDNITALIVDCICVDGPELKPWDPTARDDTIM